MSVLGSMVLQGVVTSIILIPTVEVFQYFKNKRKLKQLTKFMKDVQSTHEDKINTKKTSQIH